MTEFTSKAVNLTPLAQWIAHKFDLPFKVQPNRTIWTPIPQILITDTSPLNIKDSQDLKRVTGQEDEEEIQIIAVKSPDLEVIKPVEPSQVFKEEGEIASETSEGLNAAASPQISPPPLEDLAAASPVSSSSEALGETISLGSSAPLSPVTTLDENENPKEEKILEQLEPRVEPVVPEPSRSREKFHRKPRSPIRFISHDQEENRDNVDAGWDEMRNLRDEEECKRYGLDKLGLNFPIDPTQNLGYHGFRRQRLADQFGIKGEWANLVRKSIHNRASLMLDRGMLRDIRGDRISPTVGSKRKRERGSHSWDQPPTKRVKFDDFAHEYLQTVYELKYPLMSPRIADSARQGRNWERYLQHFREGMAESELFLRFYDKSVRLTEEECQSNIDMEHLFYRFIHFYGVNPEFNCKDCAYNERSSTLVKHPF